MTYRELLAHLNKMSDKQLDLSVTFWDTVEDEYYHADIVAVDTEISSTHFGTPAEVPHPAIVHTEWIEKNSIKELSYDDHIEKHAKGHYDTETLILSLVEDGYFDSIHNAAFFLEKRYGYSKFPAAEIISDFHLYGTQTQTKQGV